MSYPVLHDFIEKTQSNTFYKKGDEYPKSGLTADPKRVSFLQKKSRKYKVVFLGAEINPAPAKAAPASGAKNGAK